MRGKPRFGLQAVLDHRRHIEETALGVVAQRRNAYDAHVHAVGRLKDEIDRSLRAPWFAGAARVADVRVREVHVASLQRAAQAQLSAAKATGDALQAAQRAAADAARQRRSVEILRDRQAAAFEARKRRADEREIVEIGATKKSLLIQFD